MAGQRLMTLRFGGREHDDTHGVDGEAGMMANLLSPMDTRLARRKTISLLRRSKRIAEAVGAPVV